MTNIKQRLIKNSTIQQTDMLNTSKFFENKDMVPTNVPMINVALSGSLSGGMTPGVTMLAGPSKHYKSSFALILTAAYLKKYPDAAVLFYDTEFGTPQQYFQRFGVDPSAVIHTPITDIEQLKHDLVKQLTSIERGDRVCVVIDSIGNLASKKEVDDAVDGKSVADMSRAKQLKSLFRIVTPHLTIKDIPMVVVNHSYKEIGMYPKDIVSGGTGAYYASDNIWLIGRSQEKTDGEISGYSFNIKIEKSRYVREGTRIPIVVTFDGGVDKWSGLFEIALEGGFIKEVSKGWYSVGQSDKKVRRAEIAEDQQFWTQLIESDQFNQFIERTYKI